MKNFFDKQESPIKKLTFAAWVLALLWLPFISGCEEHKVECLPYYGEIFPASYKGLFGMTCNGVLIKVTNTSVNSFYDWKDKKHDNVIAVRIPEGLGFDEIFGFPIDETKTLQRFYFDFRDLEREELNICTMEYGEPKRIGYMTRFSLEPCGNREIHF